MNRKNQGSQSRGQGQNWQVQNQPRGMRAGQNYDQDDNEGMMSGSRGSQNANYSGLSSFGEDDSTNESEFSPGYRDTDYDLDGSTYTDRQDRSGRDMSERNRSSYTSDYETNDRNRTPSKFSSLDDERSDSSSERFGSSAEKFGYPSQMNPWSSSRSMGGGSRNSGRDSRMGSDYGFDSGSRMGSSNMGSQSRMGSSNMGSQSRMGSSNMGSQSRMGSQSSMGSQFGNQSEMGMGSSQSYGEGSLGNDWGSSTHDRGFYGKGPKGYKRSDERIKEEVCETLARNPRVDASDIEVNVSEACVTLSGTVDSRDSKRAAEMAIENLSGVDDVRNELKVKKPGILSTLFGDSKDTPNTERPKNADTVSAVGSSAGSSSASASGSKSSTSKGTTSI
jgi:osmotically-inducible protein OsmY